MIFALMSIVIVFQLMSLWSAENVAQYEQSVTVIALAITVVFQQLRIRDLQDAPPR